MLNSVQHDLIYLSVLKHEKDCKLCLFAKSSFVHFYENYC